jgi:hypothetical protein
VREPGTGAREARRGARASAAFPRLPFPGGKPEFAAWKRWFAAGERERVENGKEIVDGGFRSERAAFVPFTNCPVTAKSTFHFLFSTFHTARVSDTLPRVPGNTRGVVLPLKRVPGNQTRVNGTSVYAAGMSV